MKTTRELTALLEAMTPGPMRVEVWDYTHANPPRKELIVLNDAMAVSQMYSNHGCENPYTVPHSQAQANAEAFRISRELIQEVIRLRQQLEAIKEAADPFVRATRLQDPLGLRDDLPVQQCFPGGWPKMGEARALVRVIEAAS